MTNSYFDVSDLDQLWVDLLQGQINSLSRWDCLRYFLEFDDLSATLDEIAMAAGRDSMVLLDDLGALTSEGLLVRRVDFDGETTYQLTQSDQLRRTLETFHSAMQADDFRLKVLYQWTRGRNSDPATF